MASKIEIRDLVARQDMDNDALSAIRGGAIAERFLFMGRGAGASGAQVINQFFGDMNFNYQDDRDTIFADRDSTVINTGGNSNTTTMQNTVMALESSITAQIAGLINDAL